MNRGPPGLYHLPNQTGTWLPLVFTGKGYSFVPNTLPYPTFVVSPSEIIQSELQAPLVPAGFAMVPVAHLPPPVVGGLSCPPRPQNPNAQEQKNEGSTSDEGVADRSYEDVETIVDKEEREVRVDTVEKEGEHNGQEGDDSDNEEKAGRRRTCSSETEESDEDDE